MTHVATNTGGQYLTVRAFGELYGAGVATDVGAIEQCMAGNMSLYALNWYF